MGHIAIPAAFLATIEAVVIDRLPEALVGVPLGIALALAYMALSGLWVGFRTDGTK